MKGRATRAGGRQVGLNAGNVGSPRLPTPLRTHASVVELPPRRQEAPRTSATWRVSWGPRVAGPIAIPRRRRTRTKVPGVWRHTSSRTRPEPPTPSGAVFVGSVFGAKPPTPLAARAWRPESARTIALGTASRLTAKEPPQEVTERPYDQKALARTLAGEFLGVVQQVSQAPLAKPLPTLAGGGASRSILFLGATQLLARFAQGLLGRLNLRARIELTPPSFEGAARRRRGSRFRWA